MSDYALVRSRSLVVPRSRSLDRSSSLLVSSGFHTPSIKRTASVPDLTGYIRYSDSYVWPYRMSWYKPHWHTVHTYSRYAPWRFTRDYDLYDDYWYDRYSYSSPYSTTYGSYYYPKRTYYSDPYFWYPYSSYWNRYHSYSLWYDYPSYYSRYYGPSYYPRTSLWTPYSSRVLDSAAASVSRGLNMYRAGLITFPVLNNYWLTPNYWDKRFKDYRQLYTTNKPQYSPEWVESSTKQYLAQWV